MKDDAGVELIDFWPDGYIGHTDSNGLDIGKHFLINLLSNIGNKEGSAIRVYSHFNKIEKFEHARKFLRTLKNVIERDSLKRRTKLHGHDLKKQKLVKNSVNIWYTSENLRPPLNEEYNLFLSHDLDPYDGRNVYLPIWATRLGSDILTIDSVQKTLISHRNPTGLGRKGICAVISNPEPIRMAFIKEAQKYFEVDVYGAFGIPLQDKAKVLQEYKLNICFENDEFPGYVTEKPFEAWINGCIPVWRGLDSGAYINEDAIINVTKDGFSKSFERIQSILNDSSEFNRMSSLPILRKKYDYEDLRIRISSAV